MSRYIDAIKLKSDMMEAICQGYTEEDMLGIVNEQDTADVVEVKHGHWEIAIGYDPKKAFQCSECRLMSYDPTEFCPHCGAKMDEVKE